MKEKTKKLTNYPQINPLFFVIIIPCVIVLILTILISGGVICNNTITKFENQIESSNRDIYNVHSSIFVHNKKLKESGFNSSPEKMKELQILTSKYRLYQQNKIDIIRAYKDRINDFPFNIYANIFGYPKKSWHELETKISFSHTDIDFSLEELNEPYFFID